jgi:hypothetical protein
MPNRASLEQMEMHGFAAASAQYLCNAHPQFRMCVVARKRWQKGPATRCPGFCGGTGAKLVTKEALRKYLRVN